MGKKKASVHVVGYSEQLCIAAICDNTHNMNACRHMQQRLGHIQADHVYVCVAWFKQDKTVFKKKKSSMSTVEVDKRLKRFEVVFMKSVIKEKSLCRQKGTSCSFWPHHS